MKRIGILLAGLLLLTGCASGEPTVEPMSDGSGQRQTWAFPPR